MDLTIPNGSTEDKSTITNRAAVRHFDLCKLILIAYFSISSTLLFLMILIFGCWLSFYFSSTGLSPCVLIESYLFKRIHSHRLKIVRIAIKALINMRILCDRLMAWLSSFTHSDEKTYVEINSQTENWLDVFLLTIGNLTDHS